MSGFQDSYKISLLIPCYNQEKHIRSVVEAVLSQTRQVDEIIVLDDHSQDDSVAILRNLPVQLICNKQNQGPTIARNKLFSASSGDILVFIDSDAYADPQMVESMLSAYQLPSSRPIAGVGGRGIETQLVSMYDHWRNAHARQDFGLKAHDDVPYLYGLCMSFHRDALLDVNGFDPFFPINAGEDLDLGYRLRRRGYILRYTPEAIVYHQHQDDEASLKRVQYNWYYWSYLAKRRNQYPTWYLYAGIVRRLFRETLTDMLLQRNFQLVKLDIEIFAIRVQALIQAAKVPAIRSRQNAS